MTTLKCVVAVLLPSLFFFLSDAATSDVPPSPVCAGGSRALPVALEEPLRFCDGDGGGRTMSCCDAVDDAALREQFESMNISDGACAAIIKALVCARCSPSLSALFNTVDPATITKLAVPVLCASTPSSSAQQQHPLASSTRSPEQHETMCVERISAGSSHRVFLPTKDGICTCTRPAFGPAWRPRRAGATGAKHPPGSPTSAATDRGVYRVVPPALCGGVPPRQPPQGSPAGTSWQLSFGAFAMVFALYLVYSTMCAGGGGRIMICNGCCGTNTYAEANQHEA